MNVAPLDIVAARSVNGIVSIGANGMNRRITNKRITPVATINMLLCVLHYFFLSMPIPCRFYLQWYQARPGVIHSKKNVHELYYMGAGLSREEREELSAARELVKKLQLQLDAGGPGTKQEGDGSGRSASDQLVLSPLPNEGTKQKGDKCVSIHDVDYLNNLQTFAIHQLGGSVLAHSAQECERFGGRYTPGTEKTDANGFTSISSARCQMPDMTRELKKSIQQGLCRDKISSSSDFCQANI